MGANARWTIAKRVDFGLHAFGGNAVGRYGSGGLADAFVHANGTLDLIRGYQGPTTLEWHGSKLDIYLNAGAEYAPREADFDPVTLKYVGYGSPFFKNAGCYSEIGPKDGTGFLPGSLSVARRIRASGSKARQASGTCFTTARRTKVNHGRPQFGVQYSCGTRNNGLGRASGRMELTVWSSPRSATACPSVLKPRPGPLRGEVPLFSEARLINPSAEALPAMISSAVAEDSYALPIWRGILKTS